VILKIVQYQGATSYYLFYCDENGREVTDTLHDTVEEAQSQAEWEFGVTPEEWEHHVK